MISLYATYKYRSTILLPPTRANLFLRPCTDLKKSTHLHVKGYGLMPKTYMSSQFTVQNETHILLPSSKRQTLPHLLSKGVVLPLRSIPPVATGGLDLDSFLFQAARSCSVLLNNEPSAALLLRIAMQVAKSYRRLSTPVKITERAGRVVEVRGVVKQSIAPVEGDGRADFESSTGEAGLRRVAMWGYGEGGEVERGDVLEEGTRWNGWGVALDDGGGGEVEKPRVGGGGDKGRAAKALIFAALAVGGGASRWLRALAAWQAVNPGEFRRDEGRCLRPMGILRLDSRQCPAVGIAVLDKTGTVSQSAPRCERVRFFGASKPVKDAVKTAMSWGESEFERGIKPGTGGKVVGGRAWNAESREKVVEVEQGGERYRVVLGSEVGSDKVKAYAEGLDGRCVRAVCHDAEGKLRGEAVGVWRGSVRADSKAAVEEMKKMKVRVVMASGDGHRPVIGCCGEVGIDVDFSVVEWGRKVAIGGKNKPVSRTAFRKLMKSRKFALPGLDLSKVKNEELGNVAAVFAATPAQKRSLVARLSAGGEGVCMVGDGHNDAAAMEEAALSVAVLSGLEGKYNKKKKRKKKEGENALTQQQLQEDARQKIEERLGHMVSNPALVSGVKGAKARVASTYLICRPSISTLPALLSRATAEHEATRVLISQRSAECWLQALDFWAMAGEKYDSRMWMYANVLLGVVGEVMERGMEKSKGVVRKRTGGVTGLMPAVKLSVALAAARLGRETPRLISPTSPLGMCLSADLKTLSLLPDSLASFALETSRKSGLRSKLATTLYITGVAQTLSMCAFQGNSKVVGRSRWQLPALVAAYGFLTAVLFGWIDVGQKILAPADLANLYGLLLLDGVLTALAEVLERGRIEK